MREFKTYHPIVNFIYFVFVIGFSCFFMHPVSLAISLLSGFLYSVMLKGRKAIKRNLIYMLPILFAMILINPLLNHEGATVLGYFPDGNPLTLESVVYGFCAAAMIASVVCHFSCYNEVMTSDKFIYLFGKIIPGMSLIISMTLRFVPRFVQQTKVITNAQRTIGRDITNGSLVKRVRCGLNILSVMTTWSLENSIETADSMKSRGYGMPGRSTFSVFAFNKRDKKALVFILLLGMYTFFGYLMGGMNFSYFPVIKSAEISPFGVSVFLTYMLLCICPAIIEIWEAIRWKVLRSKI